MNEKNFQLPHVLTSETKKATERETPRETGAERERDPDRTTPKASQHQAKRQRQADVDVDVRVDVEMKESASESAVPDDSSGDVMVKSKCQDWLPLVAESVGIRLRCKQWLGYRGSPG